MLSTLNLAQELGKEPYKKQLAKYEARIGELQRKARELGIPSSSSSKLGRRRQGNRDQQTDSGARSARVHRPSHQRPHRGGTPASLPVAVLDQNPGPGADGCFRSQLVRTGAGRTHRQGHQEKGMAGRL